jgi:hypothetical protein
VDKVFASLLADLVGGEARTLVKLCVRQAVQQLVPTKTNAVDGGVYSQLFAVLLLEAVAAEARIVVGEAVQEVANDYVARRGAERVVESMLEELMTDECGPIAEGARIKLPDTRRPVVVHVDAANNYGGGVIISQACDVTGALAPIRYVSWSWPKEQQPWSAGKKEAAALTSLSIHNL